ncbi:unannotated protein [freshwater metagenome]|uniref:Unannotated protein n=1 Tax=freshwater metagenome TaxID=449393 RepID=A0A6J5YZD2_9ZZZZ
MQEIVDSVADIEKVNTLQILQHQRAVRDQSKLNSSQRAHNIEGAFSTIFHRAMAPDVGNIGPLIIVDDLVTTGSTLAEAIRALRAAGFPVIGAVTGAVSNPYD